VLVRTGLARVLVIDDNAERAALESHVPHKVALEAVQIRALEHNFDIALFGSTDLHCPSARPGTPRTYPLRTIRETEAR